MQGAFDYYYDYKLERQQSVLLAVTFVICIKCDRLRNILHNFQFILFSQLISSVQGMDHQCFSLLW